MHTCVTLVSHRRAHSSCEPREAHISPSSCQRPNRNTTIQIRARRRSRHDPVYGKCQARGKHSRGCSRHLLDQRCSRRRFSVAIRFCSFLLRTKCVFHTMNWWNLTHLHFRRVDSIAQPWVGAPTAMGWGGRRPTALSHVNNSYCHLMTACASAPRLPISSNDAMVCVRAHAVECGLCVWV